MPKGGARSRSGPAPDPNALRRDRSDDAGWVTLPAEGRDGPPPGWPLAEATLRELELWAGEWCRPQAVEWERQGQQVEVAMFVRSLVDAESHRATAASRTLVRQQMDSLGISEPGRRSNRWLIGDPEVPPEARPQRSSSKSRLKVVEDVDTA